MSAPYAPTDLTAPVPWTAPEGTAAHAAAQAEQQPKHSAAEALAQDANPPEYPPGAPELRPYMRLPRRERAEFFVQLDPLQEKVSRMPAQGTSIGLREAAEMYQTMADIEDLLRTVAVDQTEFDAWVVEADDKAFMELFTAYFARSQPGEAARSSS